MHVERGEGSMKGPFNQKEANSLRLEGKRVVACWFCLHKSAEKPYWLQSETTIRKGEHVIRCRNHRGDA